MRVIIKGQQKVFWSQRTVTPKEKPSFNDWTSYLHKQVKGQKNAK